MASTKHNTYDITLNRDLFVDPDFKKFKKFDSFFPLKYSTIDHRLWEHLSSYGRLMLIQLLSIAYNEVSISFTVSTAMLHKYRGIAAEMLLLELSDLNYLQSSKLKEYLNQSHIKANLNKTTRSQKQAPAEASENLPDLSVKKTNQFISKYCELFKAKHGSNPVINGKTSGIAKRLSQSLGEEKANFYLEAFFAMPDALLFKNKHPLAQFEFKLNEITVFANSGKFTTYKQANQQDHTATVQSQIDRIKAGQL